MMTKNNKRYIGSAVQKFSLRLKALKNIKDLDTRRYFIDQHYRALLLGVKESTLPKTERGPILTPVKRLYHKALKETYDIRTNKTN